MTGPPGRPAGAVNAVARPTSSPVSETPFSILRRWAADRLDEARIHMARPGALVSLSLLGLVLCLAALVTLLWQTALTAPDRIWILVVMISVAFVTELAFRLVTGRKLRVFKLAGE